VELIFAVGTLWFWLLVTVASILVLCCIEFEKGFFAFVTLVVTAVVLEKFGGLQILAHIKAHPLWVLGYVGAYFFLGTFWGVNKWWFFVRRQREKYDEARNLFEEDCKSGNYRVCYAGAEILPEEPEKAALVMKEEWAHCVEHGSYDAVTFTYKPDPKKHKALIMSWMAYWPWSFFWTLLNDPIKRIFRGIIHRISGFMKRMSDRAFQDATPADHVNEEENAKFGGNGLNIARLQKKGRIFAERRQTRVPPFE